MLSAGDKKWIKSAIVEGVTEGINQVMIPYSEEQEKRFNAKFKSIDEKFEDLRSDLSGQIFNLERKLDNVTDQQAEKLDNHEERIGKLEVAVA